MQSYCTTVAKIKKVKPGTLPDGRAEMWRNVAPSFQRQLVVPSMRQSAFFFGHEARILSSSETFMTAFNVGFHVSFEIHLEIPSFRCSG